MLRYLRYILVTCIVLFIAGVALVLFMIQPTEKNLDISYQSIPWGNKLAAAILNHGNVTLSDQDVTNLFKSQLTKKYEESNASITGAKMTIESDQIHGWMVLQKGPLPVGVSFRADVHVVGQDIVITPTMYWIGRISLQPATFSKLVSMVQQFPLPADFHVHLPLPPGIKLKSIQMRPGKVELQFAINRIL
jgi:hypothetical protein